MRRILGGQKNAHPSRLVMTAVLMLVGAVVVAIAISTGTLRLWSSDNTGPPIAEQSAEDRCQSEVLKRVVSASTAHLSQVHTEASSLDVDGRDQFFPSPWKSHLKASINRESLY